MRSEKKKKTARLGHSVASSRPPPASLARWQRKTRPGAGVGRVRRRRGGARAPKKNAPRRLSRRCTWLATEACPTLPASAGLPVGMRRWGACVVCGGACTPGRRPMRAHVFLPPPPVPPHRQVQRGRVALDGARQPGRQQGGRRGVGHCRVGVFMGEMQNTRRVSPRRRSLWRQRPATPSDLRLKKIKHSMHAWGGEIKR